MLEAISSHVTIAGSTDVIGILSDVNLRCYKEVTVLAYIAGKKEKFNCNEKGHSQINVQSQTSVESPGHRCS